MRLVKQPIEGLYVVESDAHTDDRGTFRRSFCRREFSRHGINFEVLQTNVSINPTCHTLRGFHYQRPPSVEKKILDVVSGGIFHAVVDVRSGSDTFLQHAIFQLSAGEESGVLIPEGLASAFLTLAPDTIVVYHMADFYDSERYAGIRYDDPLLSIEWPFEPVLISEKDRSFPNLDPAGV